jgi:hypothetical protein
MWAFAAKLEAEADETILDDGPGRLVVDALELALDTAAADAEVDETGPRGRT